MQIQQIKVTDLNPHPKNPRLILREDVIESIRAGLTDGFHPCHAITAWKSGGGLFVISGHHRLEAAKRSGIESVPCFVRDDLDEDGAYMMLATANAQGELSPLEIGCHAHGLKHGSAKEYAAAIGRSAAFVSQVRSAFEVAKLSQLNFSAAQSKAQHLAAIHKLPSDAWAGVSEAMLKGDWSAKDTAERVSEASAYLDSPKCTTKRIVALVSRATRVAELDRIDALVASVAESLTSQLLRDEWIAWAKSDPIDIKSVQESRIAFENRDAELKEVEETELPNLVLADPPWRYDFAETDNRQIENQYPSATVEDICDKLMPQTQDNAVLFLWATVAKLQETMQVMEAWGFKYKTGAVWDKEKIGMGYWFRGQHELLLVGTKGEFSPPEQDKRVSSVFREARGKHSAKPECVYSWIESAFPTAIKLEMFCRSPRPGWMTFGNEAK